MDSVVGVHSGPKKALILRSNYTSVENTQSSGETYGSIQLGKASPTLRMSTICP